MLLSVCSVPGRYLCLIYSFPMTQWLKLFIFVTFGKNLILVHQALSNLLYFIANNYAITHCSNDDVESIISIKLKIFLINKSFIRKFSTPLLPSNSITFICFLGYQKWQQPTEVNAVHGAYEIFSSFFKVTTLLNPNRNIFADGN